MGISASHVRLHSPRVTSYVALLLLVATAHVSRAQEMIATTTEVSGDVSLETSTDASTSHPSSRSRGLPWEGELRDGVWLNQSSTVRHLPQFRAHENFYGTRELVGVLRRVADSIARRWIGSRLTVGELSARQGGWIEGHHSHRNGRDADIAFFMRSHSGRLMPFWRFVAFGRTGPERSVDGHLRFDDSRNWALVAQLLRDQEARVQYIFVANPIRARLLVEGRKRGESADFLRAAAAVMVEPQRGHRHENHFHVRIYCSRHDRPACEDKSPYWPWFDGRSPEGVYTELPILRWRPTRASAPDASSESTQDNVAATEGVPESPASTMSVSAADASDNPMKAPAAQKTSTSAPPTAPRSTGT